MKILGFIKGKWQISLIAVLAILLLLGSFLSDGQIAIRNVGINIKDMFTIGMDDMAYAAGTPDYTCNGVNDSVEIQKALDALPVGGGKITILAGTYNLSATVSRAIDNVIIEGEGFSTILKHDNSTPIFDAGVQNGWAFRDLKTDKGGIDVADAGFWSFENVVVGLDYIAYRTSSDADADDWGIPSGRGNAYTVAASNAPSDAVAQADYVCDGKADNVEIQAAIDAIKSSGGTVHLTSGTFKISNTINLPGSVSLRGEGMAAFSRIGTTIWLTSSSNCDMIHISGLNSKHRFFGGIEDMQIRGNSYNNASGDGIVVDSANGEVSDLLFRSIFISDIADNGIVLDTGWYTRFDTVWVEFCDVGVYVTTNYSGDVWFSESNLTCNVNSLFIEDNSFADLQFIGGCIGYDTQDSVTIDNSRHVLFSGTLFWGAQSLINSYDAVVIKNASQNIILDSCTFDGQSKTRYAVNIQDTSSNITIVNSMLNDYTGSFPIVDNGTHNIIENNTGYISPGESRTDSGSITGGAAGAMLFAWHNPEVQDILIKKVVINITTSDAGAANIDCGIADDASYTTGGTEFFHNLKSETVQINDSWSTRTGTQTVWVSCQDSASVIDGWVVAKILDKDCSDLEGVYYIEYVGA